VVTVRRLTNAEGDSRTTMTLEQFRATFEDTNALLARRLCEACWEQVGVLDVKDEEEVLVVEPLVGG